MICLEAGDLTAPEVSAALQLAGLHPDGGLDGVPGGSVEMVRLALGAVRAGRQLKPSGSERQADELRARRPAGPLCSVEDLKRLERAAEGLTEAGIRGTLAAVGLGPDLESVPPSKVALACQALEASFRTDPPLSLVPEHQRPLGWLLGDFVSE